MIDVIKNLFEVCCQFIYVIGQYTGLGYELTNLLIFVVIHPLLTLSFYLLWRNSKNREKTWRKIYNEYFST